MNISSHIRAGVVQVARIAAVLVAVAAILCAPVLAFDYAGYGTPNSADTFRLLDEPAQTQGPAGPEIVALPNPATSNPVPPIAALSSPAPGPALVPVPVVVAQVPAPYSNPTWATQQPAIDYVPPTVCPTPMTCPAGCGLESSWYTKIEYFHWNETVDGANFETEEGPLYTVGYQWRAEHNRFRAEFFGSQVHSGSDVDFGGGDIEPLSSHTNYLGGRVEYEYLFEPETLPRIDFYVGLGSRLWYRVLPNAFTEEGSFVLGYQETWWTLYPYLGIETRHNPQADLEWYAAGRIGLTAFTLQNADVIPSVTLYPKPGLEAEAEAGVRGKRLFVGAFFEVMSWAQSAISDGWLQPNSTMYTVGLKTGVYF
ncbi:MAG TPA: hypothetical protein VMJ32_12605 [Pirellulales bacterium]|nr:hypothetical protein [Pirellulales bacterium]